MSQLYKVQYQKEGAVFADGTEAKLDKHSMYGDELLQSVVDSENNLIQEGILLQPYLYTWDQETFVITVNKYVTSKEDYLANRTYNGEAVLEASSAAGWTFIGSSVDDLP
jgi:hypothetical protein